MIVMFAPHQESSSVGYSQIMQVSFVGPEPMDPVMVMLKPAFVLVQPLAMFIKPAFVLTHPSAMVLYPAIVMSTPH